MKIEDLKLMIEWLNNNELTYYYDEKFESNNDIVEKYLPRINNPNKICPCILELNNLPVGYMQFYKIDEKLYEKLNYKTDLEVYGIDQFLSDCINWGKGLGSQFIILILNFLREEYQAKKVVLDVKNNNLRAIRAYKKCGFKKIRCDKIYTYMEWNSNLSS